MIAYSKKILNNPIIKFEKVYLYKGDRYILKDISFTLNANDDCLVLGKNGSGKSSLINLIYGYNWATEGNIEVFNYKFGEIPLRILQKRIGILEPSQQESRLQRNLTIRDILITGILSTIGLYTDISSEESKLIDDVINSNSWIKNPHQKFDTLSSGEKKKILLLRALVNKPELLILDEPCAFMDFPSREDFLQYLRLLKQEYNFTLIYITHSLEEIQPFIKKVLLLKNGELLKIGSTENCLTDELLTNLYDYPCTLGKINSTYHLSRL